MSRPVPSKSMRSLFAALPESREFSHGRLSICELRRTGCMSAEYAARGIIPRALRAVGFCANGNSATFGVTLCRRRVGPGGAGCNSHSRDSGPSGPSRHLVASSHVCADRGRFRFEIRRATTNRAAAVQAGSGRTPVGSRTSAVSKCLTV